MKRIKSYYNYLDLPYDASEEDVWIKQKTMVRLCRTKAIKDGEKSNSTIRKINQAASTVIGYIRENGPMTVEQNHRETIKNEIFALLLAILVTFALVFMIL